MLLLFFQALVKYTEFVYNMVLASKSLKIIFKGGEKTMLIGLTIYLSYSQFIICICICTNWQSIKLLVDSCLSFSVKDSTASTNLELVHNARDPRSINSLCGVLNHTKTPGGGESVLII